ncbi:unnamed protein product, partial [Polarella glacialis]
MVQTEKRTLSRADCKEQRWPSSRPLHDSSLGSAPACLGSKADDLWELLPAELRPQAPGRWLVVGGCGARDQLHRHPPWLGWDRLLAGSKRWRLLPPDAKIASHAIGTCGAMASGVDAFGEVDAVGASSGSQSLSFFEARQAPGDTLLVPPGWWQQELHEAGPTISVVSQLLNEQ